MKWLNYKYHKYNNSHIDTISKILLAIADTFPSCKLRKNNKSINIYLLLF